MPCRGSALMAPRYSTDASKYRFCLKYISPCWMWSSTTCCGVFEQAAGTKAIRRQTAKARWVVKILVKFDLTRGDPAPAFGVTSAEQSPSSGRFIGPADPSDILKSFEFGMLP